MIQSGIIVTVAVEFHKVNFKKNEINVDPPLTALRHDSFQLHNLTW